MSERDSSFAAICAGLLVLLSACSGGERATPTPAPAAFDPSYLDQGSDPCTDFYQFACGTWIAQHPIQPGYDVERYIDGDFRDDIYFYQLVEAMTSDDPNLTSAQHYYNTCVATNARSSAPAGTLGAQITAIKAMSSLADLPSTLGRLHASGVAALFYLYPQIDAGNSTQYTLVFGDYGWSLPAPESYQDPTLAAAYRMHMTALALAAESAAVNVSLDPQAVFDFESAIASADDESTDPVSRYNPTDTTQLALQLPGFDWAAYIAALGFGNATRVDSIDPSFLPKLAALLAATPFETLQQYLEWRVLETDASSVDQPLAGEEFFFHRTVLRGQQPQAADTDYDCLIATRNQFGFSLARHFVDSFVPSDLKPAASDLADSLRAAMSANFAQVSWLDDATRAAAMQKFELLLPKVGYPEAWPTDTINIGANDAFLDMWLELTKQAWSSAAAQLVAPVDRSLFWASPEITNAFYSPARNDITIPVAVLQDPFFRQDRPAAFNFGALGSVIGHELTHGFDSNGRHYDGTGTLADWWTDSAATEFEQRTQCLVDQYNGYEALPGLNIDGAATLNENIADLGGLKLSYAAFEAQAKRGSAMGGFTPEAQFFLSFAQLWCSNSSDDTLRNQIATDPHSPAKFRVNGVVRNLPEFARAFSCPAGSPLAPPNRCEIW
jgi:putative endopeptidase